MSYKRRIQQEPDDGEIRKQTKDILKESMLLEQLKKSSGTQRAEEAVGVELAARRNQSGRCSEGGENTMKIEEVLVAQENTMFVCEENKSTMEDKPRKAKRSN